MRAEMTEDTFAIGDVTLNYAEGPSPDTAMTVFPTTAAVVTAVIAIASRLIEQTFS